MMRRILTAALVSMLCVGGAHAFEIDLPKDYVRKRDAKWKREAKTIWREIDRSAIEAAIRDFVHRNPTIDGVELASTTGDLAWKFENPMVIRCGGWTIGLLEWEATYPALSRIKWKEATLVVSVPYDWKTKQLGGEGNAEIRLLFAVARSGRVFKRRTIQPDYRSMDYGEVFLLLPFGGVELRKDGRT
jgi:hypothetical protein